jgi:hypothetical protein
MQSTQNRFIFGAIVGERGEKVRRHKTDALNKVYHNL